MKLKNFLAIMVIVGIFIFNPVQAKEFSFMIHGFEKESYEITIEIKKSLKKIIEKIPRNSRIKINGFADRDEILNSYENIPEERALAISKLINKKTGINNIQYKSAGIGKSPSDELNRAINILINFPKEVDSTQVELLAKEYKQKNKALWEKYKQKQKKIKPTQTQQTFNSLTNSFIDIKTSIKKNIPTDKLEIFGTIFILSVLSLFLILILAGFLKSKKIKKIPVIDNNFSDKQERLSDYKSPVE